MSTAKMRLLRALQLRFESLTPGAVGFFRSYLSRDPMVRHKWLNKAAVCGMFDSTQLEYLHQLKETGVITALYVMDRVNNCAYARFIPDSQSVKELMRYARWHHFRPSRAQVLAWVMANGAHLNSDQS